MLAVQGQQTPVFQKRVKEGTRGFPGMVDELQKKENEEGNKARSLEFQAEQQLASALEKTILPAFEKALQVIAEKLDALTKEFNTKLLQNNQ